MGIFNDLTCLNVSSLFKCSKILSKLLNVNRIFNHLFYADEASIYLENWCLIKDTDSTLCQI